MKLSIKHLFFCVLLFLTSSANAQLKIGYILSERIRTEYEEFKDAEAQLQLEYRQVNMRYNSMIVELDSIKQSFETQRLMSSPERRREQEAEIVNLETQVNDFQTQKVGPQGELYQKQLQLETRIIQKVQRAVNKVAIDKGYDYILDSVSLLYGKPTHNLTDDVLYELRRLTEESTNSN